MYHEKYNLLENQILNRDYAAALATAVEKGLGDCLHESDCGKIPLSQMLTKNILAQISPIVKF